MATILFVLSVVAAGSSGREYTEWRALAEFSTPVSCQAAIKTLDIPASKARCVPK